MHHVPDTFKIIFCDLSLYGVYLYLWIEETQQMRDRSHDFSFATTFYYART